MWRYVICLLLLTGLYCIAPSSALASNGDGASPVGSLCDSQFSDVLSHMPPWSAFGITPYAFTNSCWAGNAYPLANSSTGMALGNQASDYFFRNILKINPCAVAAAALAARGGGAEATPLELEPAGSVPSTSLEPVGGGSPKPIKPLWDYCPTISADQIDQFSNTYVQQHFSHNAGDVLKVTFAPIHAWAFNVTSIIDYTVFADVHITVDGQSHTLYSYGTTGTYDIPLNNNSANDLLTIRGSGAAITNVVVVPAPSATPTPLPAVDCGLLLDCHFSNNGTPNGGAFQPSSFQPSSYWRGFYPGDGTTGNCEYLSIFLSLVGVGLGNNCSVQQTLSRSFVAGDVLDFHWRHATTLNGPLDGSNAQFDYTSALGASIHASSPPCVTQVSNVYVECDWRYTVFTDTSTTAYPVVTFSGFEGDNGGGSVVVVANPSLYLNPSVVTATPAPVATDTPVDQAALATTVANDVATYVARSTSVALGTVLPYPQNVTYNCEVFGACDAVVTTAAVPTATPLSFPSAAAMPLGPYPSGPSGSCTSVSWPLVTAPPDDLFPSGLQQTLLVGGAVEAAAVLVGGLWSMATQLIIPQHVTCDLTPLHSLVSSKFGWNIDKLTAVLNPSGVTSGVTAVPACEFVGVRSLVWFGRSMDVGLDPCGTQWQMAFARVRSIAQLVMYTTLVIYSIRMVDSRVRGGKALPDAG